MRWRRSTRRSTQSSPGRSSSAGPARRRSSRPRSRSGSRTSRSPSISGPATSRPRQCGRELEDARALRESLTVEKAPAGARPKLAVEVVWGDVTRVDADVYTVGHYEGVLPQRAELALDKAVSGLLGRKKYDPRSLAITRHTRRGNLRAEVGDVSFFPWAETERRRPRRRRCRDGPTRHVRHGRPAPARPQRRDRRHARSRACERRAAS